MMTSRKPDNTGPGYLTLLLLLLSSASVHRQALARHAQDDVKSACGLISTASSPCRCDFSKNHRLPEVTCHLKAESILPPAATSPIFISTLNISHSDPKRVGDVLLAWWVGRVHAVKLQHCGLTTMPEAWLRVPGLREMDLSHNNLAAFPTAPSPQLKRLDLSHNRLAVFRINHVSLRQLKLAHNKLHALSLMGVYPEALSLADLHHNQLRQVPLELWEGLRYLDLSHNLLSRLPSLNGSSALRFVDVSHNKLTELPAGLLSFTPYLDTLSLAGNQLNLSHDWSDSGQLELGGLINLNLSDTGLLHVPRALLATTSHLLHLDLSHNHLSHLKDNDFSPHGIAAPLLTLRLSHNSLQYLQPAAFHNLRHLRHLDLSHNTLLGEGLGNHVMLPEHVTVLDLRKCSLRHVDLCQFSHMHKLKQLYLHDNPLVCTCHLSLLYRWYGKHGGSPRDHQSLNTQRPWMCVPNQTGAQVSIPKQPPSSDTVQSLFTGWVQQTTRNETSTMLNMQDSNETTTIASDTEPEEDGPGLQAARNVPNVQIKRDEMDIAPSIQAASSVKVTVKAELKDDVLITTWNVSQEEAASMQVHPNVQGFRVVCLHSGKTEAEDDVVHTSPLLPAALRSYAITNMGHKEYTICVDVLLLVTTNTTQASWRSCHEVLFDGPVVLVGILAGIIFLLPCIIFLVYITVKDKSIRGKLEEDTRDHHSLSSHMHSEDEVGEVIEDYFHSQDKDKVAEMWSDYSHPTGYQSQLSALHPVCLAHPVAAVSIATQTDITDDQLAALKAFPSIRHGPVSSGSTSTTVALSGASLLSNTSLTPGTAVYAGTSLPPDTFLSSVLPDRPSSCDSHDHSEPPPLPPRPIPSMDAATDSCSNEDYNDSTNKDDTDGCEKDLAGTLNNLDWLLAQLQAISE